MSRIAAVVVFGLLTSAGCSASGTPHVAVSESPLVASLTPSPSPSPSRTATAVPSLVPVLAVSPCTEFPATPATMVIAGRTVRIASPSHPSTRVPVIMALAGYDQSAATLDQIASLTTRLGSSALVIVAEGLGSPLAWQFRSGQTRDVQWLRSVRQVATQSCGDPGRVLLAGLSDGGVMAVRAACMLGVDALVTSSASARPPEGCTLPRTMLAEHGTNDTFDPYEGDGADIPPARDAIAAWAVAAKCTQSQESDLSGAASGTRLAYTACSLMHSVDLYTLQGAPHGWPTSFDLTGMLLGQLGARALPASAAFTYSISGLTAHDLPYSWHSGCPLDPSHLRRLSVTYLGFDGQSHQGLVDVNQDVATNVVGVFRAVYAAHYPIRQLRPVDDFGGSDDRSTSADNTAGFNCRQAVGGSGWSQHAYGHAIDIDPVENPYVDNGQVLPSNGAPYTDRSQHKPGMVHSGDAVHEAFASIGWQWGGRWGSSPDYQHFSSTGT